MQLSLKMLAIPNERPTLESYTDNLVTFVPFQLHLITTQSNVYIYIYIFQRNDVHSEVMARDVYSIC